MSELVWLRACAAPLSAACTAGLGATGAGWNWSGGAPSIMPHLYTVYIYHHYHHHHTSCVGSAPVCPHDCCMESELQLVTLGAAWWGCCVVEGGDGRRRHFAQPGGVGVTPDVLAAVCAWTRLESMARWAWGPPAHENRCCRMRSPAWGEARGCSPGSRSPQKCWNLVLDLHKRQSEG